MSLRKMTIAAVKLALSGVIIAAIAAVFLVISPDADVSEAQADLTDFIPASVHKHGNFDRAMRDLGFEPRFYDYNGNIVQFAVAETPLPPMEFMEQFQHRMTQSGINSRTYDAPEVTPHHADIFQLLERRLSESNRERDLALLNGEMVPIIAHEGHVALAGMVPHREFADNDDLVSRLRVNPGVGGVELNDYMDTFRFVEARYEESTGGSHVTATWADSNFDPRKMTDPSAVDVRLDADVPPCIGCERQNRIASLEEDEPFVFNQFQTTSSTESVRDFYSQAMTQRGWELSGTSRIFDEFRSHIPELGHYTGDMMVFERDGEFVNFFIDENPQNYRTSVLSIRGQ